MATPEQNERFDKAMTALEKVIDEHAGVFGPQACEVHGDECMLEDDECISKPADAMTVLRGFVLVTEWANVDGTSNIEYAMPRDQMTSSTVGLLVHARDTINYDIFGR